MKHPISAVFFALLVVVAAGCSNTPSQQAAEDSLSRKIESESAGKIKLVSFKKTDGQKIEGDGMQAYNMDYEAEIEFQMDGVWSSGAVVIAFGFSPGQPKQGSWAGFANQIDGGKPVKHGDRVKLAGVMAGVKKESGWVFEVRNAKIVAHTTADNAAGPIARLAARSRKLTEAESADECISNLRLIQGAKGQWALAYHKKMTDTATVEDLRPFLGRGSAGEFPVCPSGGTYIINSYEQKPQCSVPGHVLQ